MIHYGYIVLGADNPNPYALDRIEEEKLDIYTGPLEGGVDAKLKRVIVKT